MAGKKRCLSWVRVYLFIIVVMLPGTMQAQQIEFSSSLNPVGSGARATGMGGAFISVADDATAASWNPAGLIQLEKPEVSAVHSYFNRKQEFSSSAHPEVESEHSTGTHSINYASAAYPFVLFNRNMVVSLNYQRLYDMNKFTAFQYNTPDPDGTITQKVSFDQSGYLYALSPAFAVQIVPGLSVGATFNMWQDFPGENGWSSEQRQHVISNFGEFLSDEKITEKKKTTFRGYNANFGVLWSPSDKFTIGAVYKTSFDARLKEETKGHNTQDIYILGNLVDSSSLRFSTSQRLTMRMPASYGIGVSYRHSDAWLVALDLYRTEWSRFVVRDEHGQETNPLTRRPISDGRLTDTTQVRLGTEYLFIKDKYVVPVRFGLFYDPEPAMKSPDDFYGVSFGTGYAWGRVAFDLSYQYRFGEHVTTDVPAIKGSSLDVRQHTIMTSLIFYF